MFSTLSNKSPLYVTRFAALTRPSILVARFTDFVYWRQHIQVCIQFFEYLNLIKYSITLETDYFQSSCSTRPQNTHGTLASVRLIKVST